MSFFKKIFGTDDVPNIAPAVKFGRYTDAYKSPRQYNAWEEALNAFEHQRYLDAYEAFLVYLLDQKEQNVHWTRQADVCHFEIVQGSKKIIGKADKTKVRVETIVTKTNALHVGVLRRLIAANFDLKYSRYALDGQGNIVMVFDTYTLDGSPYKLYFAIKELSTHSDKLDDLLADEFDAIDLPHTEILQDLPHAEKEVKYHFFIKKINETLQVYESDDLDVQQYPGGFAYLLLNTSYKLDYLTKPEGYAMEALERMHRLYFTQNEDKTNIRKNQMLQQEFEDLLKRPKEEFFKEFYNVTSTFGITSPVNHDKVAQFIEGELHNMDWYAENGHTDIALAVPGYIVGYCMFNYAVPQPDRDLFHLYYQILETDYFNALGYQLTFRHADKSLNKRAIKRAIHHIEEQHEAAFPRFAPNTRLLEYDNMVRFSASYLGMIQQLDLTPAVYR